MITTVALSAIKNMMTTLATHLDNARDQLVSGHFSAAERLYRQYLERYPPHAEACFNLGLSLHRQGQLQEAISAYQQALACQPDLIQAHQNLGHAFHLLNNLDAASHCYQQALLLNPDAVEILNNLGNVLKDQGRLDEAIFHYERALQLNPGYSVAYNNLGNAFKELGLLDNAFASYQKALELNPDHIESISNGLFVLSYHPQCTPEQYLANARQYGDRVTANARPYTAWPALAHRTGRLKVGLVSGDLRSHPIGYFLESILRHLDAERIELVAYTTKPQEDDLTTRIRPCFSAWHSLTGLSDEAAAHKIHSDGIQVLLDLSGHTAHNRLPIFAWKPAPVQASWLGYFASTGLTQMDYLLADPVSVPQAHQHHFTETIVYLPDTRLCFTAPEAPPVAPLPALQQGHITFGNFQNLSKLDDAVLSAWSSILRALPTARLRLQNAQMNSLAVRQHLQQRLANHSIADERVTLLEPGSRTAYLAAHADVDMILDTFPYPGGTTTCEALWMGVPTVTLAGTTLLARQGACLLACAGLQDWVAEDVTDYVNKAIHFASDWNALAALRRALRPQVQASVLFDAARFAGNLELALTSMWKRKINA